MARDSVGNTYLLGAEANYVILLKINPAGSIVWKRHYMTQGQNWIRNVFVDKQGNINIFFTQGNLYFIKYNQNGDSIASKKLDVIFNSSTSTNIKVNENNEIYVAGTYTNIATHIKDYIILKLDINFSTIWQYKESHPLSEINNAELNDLCFDYKGNVYFCGSDALASIGDTSNIFVTKLKPTGLFEWRRDFANIQTHSYSKNILCDSKGFVYISGMYYLPSTIINAKSILIKYNSLGKLQWYKYYHDSLMTNTDFTPIDMKMDNNGNFIIGGVMYMGNGNSNGEDFLILKYSSAGVLNGDYYFGGRSQDVLYSIDIDNKNNIYATGYKWTFDSIGHSIDKKTYTVKVNSTGQTVWETTYIPPLFEGRGGTTAKKIIIDKFENIFLACDGNIIDYSTDIYCIKYNQIVNIFPPEYLQNFSLLQNYPNPFNPSTNIEFYIFESGFYEIKIYDITGKIIGKLIQKSLIAGNYKITWNAFNNASGIYFYSLYKDGKKLDLKKMILLK
ncbi:MAG TPA: T9SS type A sorting domain-containing protein [Ignavibacteria bacterium]|nr:T9SS type A sorting domain-containing protein [Ignavibacteria bacterium]